MTIEERKRIAIAKACGWKQVRGCYIPKDELLIWNKPYEPNQSSCGFQIPDYLNDLNAMHEAEKVLRSNLNKWDEYCELLFEYEENSRLGNMGNVHATAAQKADAFIKALNLEY